ncbi:hypothetical protein evm_008532 [Chilo suppressalis]|nr:hypothetical protein evm_008532 [Chilo suppressalis]
MFKKNDHLVAQDRLYQEKVQFRRVVAKYGRLFRCPITYFRIVDRLGYGGGPRVEIIRGGLNKKYIVARLTSPYNLPISVNIYVGCKNQMIRGRPKSPTASPSTLYLTTSTTTPPPTNAPPTDKLPTDAPPTNEPTAAAPPTNAPPAAPEPER